MILSCGTEDQRPKPAGPATAAEAAVAVGAQTLICQGGKGIKAASKQQAIGWTRFGRSLNVAAAALETEGSITNWPQL